MTDLENAWNNYRPTDAPISQIIKSTQRPRRVRASTSFAGGLVAAGVAVALVVTLNPGGPSGTTISAAGPLGHMRLAAFQADLKPAASCDQLLSTYRERGLTQVSAYGWTRGGGMMPLSGMAATTVPDALKAASAPSSGAMIPGQSNSSTGTNVQEVGVDEPDSVKTNGALLVRIDGDTVAVYDVTGNSPVRISTLALPYFADGQILLSGSTLIAIGTNTDPAVNSTASTLSTRVETVSLAAPAHPQVVSDVSLSGYLTSARQHGTSVRLITGTRLPNLAFVHPTGSSPGSEARALQENRRLVSQSTLAQWLPSIDTGNGSRQLLTCDDVAITPTTVPLGTTSVIGFDVSAPTAVSAIGLSGLTSTAYESSDHLYLTGDGTQMGPCACPPMMHGGIAQPLGADKTTIFQFNLAGDQAAHVATGTVAGTIKDRWSMDEVGGVLRVATTQIVGGRQSSSVVTLKQAGATLEQIGRLDGLGAGETLTAARWFDTFAVISTAQQVDPLFSVDLTDPAHPKLLGALHIPGYSSYFHPLGNGLLLGVGQNVSFSSSGEQSQAQVGLFDISDLTNVRRLSEISLAQWTRPIAAQDPHAFTWLPDHHVALTWFGTQGTSMVLGEFTVANRAMTKTLINVPATDSTTVRTLELPNGKVVLMAGGSVTFLPLP